MGDHTSYGAGAGMIYPGLVSITFRKLQPDAIIKLVAQAGLTGIEWGGDVYVKFQYPQSDRSG